MESIESDKEIREEPSTLMISTEPPEMLTEPPWVDDPDEILTEPDDRPREPEEAPAPELTDTPADPPETNNDDVPLTAT